MDMTLDPPGAPSLAGGSASEECGPSRRYAVGWRQRLPYALLTVLTRWRDLVGMIVGVGIALSLTMTLLAANRATQDLLAGDFREAATSLYVITNGGNLVALLPGDQPGTIRDARAVLAQARSLSDVSAAIGVMGRPMEREQVGTPRRRNEPAEMVAAMGVEGDPRQIPNLLLLDDGRWLNGGDEVVVGPRFSREKGVAVGDTLRLEARDFRVVGIGRIRGLGGFVSDSLVYLDYGAFQERTGVGDALNAIGIATGDPESVRARLPTRGRLAVLTPADLIRQADAATATDRTGHWLLSLITLSIGALFVSDMLGQSVLERRAEFATLKALGVPNRTVVAVVALQAVIVGVLASVLGIILSLVWGVVLNNTVAPAYGVESFYSIDAVTVLTIFALALSLGTLAGLLPARRAVQVDPIDILREA